MLLPKSGSPRMTTKRGQKGTGGPPTMCPHGTSFTLFHPQGSPHRYPVSTSVQGCLLLAGVTGHRGGETSSQGSDGTERSAGFSKKRTVKAKRSS